LYKKQFFTYRQQSAQKWENLQNINNKIENKEIELDLANTTKKELTIKIRECETHITDSVRWDTLIKELKDTLSQTKDTINTLQKEIKFLSNKKKVQEHAYYTAAVESEEASIHYHMTFIRLWKTMNSSLNIDHFKRNTEEFNSKIETSQTLIEEYKDKLDLLNKR
jgi:hypothetical protein